MMNDEQRLRGRLAGQAAGVDVGKHPEAVDDELSGSRPEDQEETDLEEAQGRGRGSFLREMVVLFAVALTIALLIKTFVVQPFFIPSGSMEDTLLIGDKVLVNKLVYHLRPIQRGDVVVFNGDGSWNPAEPQAPPSSDPVVRLYDASLGRLFHAVRGLFGTSTDQIDFIKRVIGLPGDHVVCCNAQGLITVNGVPLHEKSYLIPGARPSQGAFNVVVPPGRLWVMGDNRPESSDSRLHDCAYTYMTPACVSYDKDGTIPENKVIGRAFLIVWPPSRFRILPIPSTFLQPALSRSSPSTPGRHAAGLAAAGRSAAVADLATAGVPVRPSAPFLPLAGGFAGAVPLTLLQRRIRRLRRRRREPRG